MSESTVKAQQCLRAFVDGNYDESLSLIDQVEEPHKLKDDKYGATLLHWAATRGWLNIVKLLLDKYEFHPMCKDNNGSTPLHSACRNSHLPIIEYLLSSGSVNPETKNVMLQTPLDLVQHNREEVEKVYSKLKTSLYCRMLYAFLENEGEIVHRLDQLCQLMADRKISENYYLPQEQEEILETLSSLHSTGLITFLKNNHTPGNSWVIVDKRVLLAKVNGVFFAPETFKQYHDISSNTGEIVR